MGSLKCAKGWWNWPLVLAWPGEKTLSKVINLFVITITIYNNWLSKTAVSNINTRVAILHYSTMKQSNLVLIRSKTVFNKHKTVFEISKVKKLKKYFIMKHGYFTIKKA